MRTASPEAPSWKVTNREQAVNGGIEGYATSTSVNPGGSLDLKINADNGAPYHVDIYRSGYYGGSQGRLIGSIRGLSGVAQPDCTNAFDTGLIDCGAWSTSATVTTSASWPTGVYLAKLVREDNNTESQILFVVRHDGGHADVLYRVPDTTYQSYNNYGGRSAYDWNSSGDPTVSGTSRAVKVSFNRPYRAGLHDPARLLHLHRHRGRVLARRSRATTSTTRRRSTSRTARRS